MNALVPQLTVLDERVLAAVPGDGRAVRAGAVVAAVFGKPWWRCERCGREAPCDLTFSRAHARGGAIGCRECFRWPDYTPTMRPILIASPEDTQTTCEILQGLRQVGLLRCGRGGWWRRTGAEGAA